MPEFPWQPLRASAIMTIPSKFFKKDNEPFLLDDIKKVISDALDSCGYVEKSYYSVPEGFAIVTRLEHINENGSPKNISERWIAEVKKS